MLCGMLVDFPMIIYFENERLVSQLSWNGTNWCPMNGQLVDQLSWYGTSAGMELVLVVQIYWFGNEVL